MRSIVAVLLTAVLCACSGGGAANMPQTSSAALVPQGDIRLGNAAATAQLPSVTGISGTLTFPAVAGGGTLRLSASATAPAGVSLDKTRRPQNAGQLAVYEYITLVPAVTVTLSSLPAIALTFPAAIATAGKSFYYGSSQPPAAGTPLLFDAHGPAAVAGQSVSFAAVDVPLTLVAGQSYTFAIYATSAATRAIGSRIYVAGNQQNSGVVFIFDADGTPSTPSQISFPISASLTTTAINAIAVDTNGKIYIAENSTETLYTFNPDGTRTTPTISGLTNPKGVAVDSAGKIYVLDNTPAVKTYAPDGTQIRPTIVSSSFGYPDGIAVARSGKIYVSNPGSYNPGTGTFSPDSVLSFNPDGTRASPTITSGLSQVQRVAVDANGLIYVASLSTPAIQVFRPDGTPSGVTIPTPKGSVGATAVAIDTSDKIYVGLFGVPGIPFDGTELATYTSARAATFPIITAGLGSGGAFGGILDIAVH